MLLELHSIETEADTSTESNKTSLLHYLQQDEEIDKNIIKIDLLPLHNNISTQYLSYFNNTITINTYEMEIEENSIDNTIPSLHDSDSLHNISDNNIYNNDLSIDLSPIEDNIEEFDIFNDLDNEYQLDSIINIVYIYIYNIIKNRVVILMNLLV